MEINDQATLQQYIDNSPESYLMPLLATLYLTDNEYPAAIDLCRQDLTIHPYSAIGHFIWALTAEAMNDIDQVVVHLQSAVQADAYFLQAYYKLIEHGQGYLTPQQQKQYYERICHLNPFDTEIAAKLAAMPADLEMLATQMKIKPPRASKAEPSARPESTSEPAQLTEEPVVEINPVQGAENLSKLFESIKKAKEPLKSPAVHTEPSIPEEEAHLGPVDLPDAEPEPERDIEPTVDFDETVVNEPPTEDRQEPAGVSAISNLFSRLREKPLDEIQKENWMMEHLAGDNPPPDKTKPPATVLETKTEQKSTSEPAEVPLPQSEIQPTAANIPAVSEQPLATKKLPAEVISPEPEPPTTEIPPVEISEPEPKPAATPPRKRAPRQPKKTTGQVNNISFPIPTWTLVDVLTKQKLFEQALSILDIIEAKSKNQTDQTKVQKSRAEIVRLMAEEQSGEA